MNHRVKMDVLTEKRGLFGTKQVIERKTVTVDGRTYRKLKQQERDQRRLAEALEDCALGIWEEEMADLFGE